MDAPYCEDIFSALFAPEHSRLLAACSDHRLASGFNHPRADKETLAPERAVLHPVDVADEIPKFLFHRVGLSLTCAFLPAFGNNLFNLVLEQSLGPLPQPAFVFGMIFAAQQSDQHLSRMLQRMIEVDDLRGSGGP